MRGLMATAVKAVQTVFLTVRQRRAADEAASVADEAASAADEAASIADEAEGKSLLRKQQQLDEKMAKGSPGVLKKSKTVEESLPKAALLTALVLDEVLFGNGDIMNHVSDKVGEIVKAIAANKIRLGFKIWKREQTRLRSQLVRTVARPP